MGREEPTTPPDAADPIALRPGMVCEPELAWLPGSWTANGAHR